MSEHLGLVVSIILVVLTVWFAAREIVPKGEPKSLGEEIVEYGPCRACHQIGSGYRAPRLEGLFMRERTLVDGRNVIANRAYLKKALLEPAAEVVDGYRPVMPSYRDVYSDKEIDSIIEYIVNLRKGGPNER